MAFLDAFTYSDGTPSTISMLAVPRMSRTLWRLPTGGVDGQCNPRVSVQGTDLVRRRHSADDNSASCPVDRIAGSGSADGVVVAGRQAAGAVGGNCDDEWAT